MYALVADIEKYPEFLPWCVALRILKDETTQQGGKILSEMVVAYKVFRERFKSEVTLSPEANQIDAHYVDGPFQHLRNQWRFEDLPDGGSIVHFLIDFEFKNVILQAAAQSVFEKAFVRMSEAFVKRADEVYR
ncbi:MAG: ubiquinone-binding protein [Hyphococcus sp.]|nr:MAG: ubiquinone-binding protein [Marinicaulis sp.]